MKLAKYGIMLMNIIHEMQEKKLKEERKKQLKIHVDFKL